MSGNSSPRSINKLVLYIVPYSNLCPVVILMSVTDIMHIPIFRIILNELEGDHTDAILCNGYHILHHCNSCCIHLYAQNSTDSKCHQEGSLFFRSRGSHPEGKGWSYASTLSIESSINRNHICYRYTCLKNYRMEISYHIYSQME